MSPRSSSGATMRPIIWTALRVVDPDADAAVVRARPGCVLGIAVRAVAAAGRRAHGVVRRAVHAVSAHVLVVAAAAVGVRRVRGRAAGEAGCERESRGEDGDPPHVVTL